MRSPAISKLELIDIETPLERMHTEHLAGKKLCIVSILRAGNGILEGMLDLLPSARVGHIGLYRDHATLQPIEYYLKLPSDVADRLVILVDPMLATGHSAAAAAQRLKQAGVKLLKFVCLLAAPEGIATSTEAHPDVPVFTGAIDRELDGRLIPPPPVYPSPTHALPHPPAPNALDYPLSPGQIACATGSDGTSGTAVPGRKSALERGSSTELIAWTDTTCTSEPAS